MHHAYLLIGDPDTAMAAVPAEDRLPCADVVEYRAEQFVIDDARRLQHEASLRPVSRPYRTFIVRLGRATAEAQNALLKLFEEPVASVRFYILVPDEERLIPTLRSRLMFLHREEVSGEVTPDVEAFIASSYADRIALIAEHIKAKDTVWAHAVVDGLEVWAAQQGDRRLQKEVLFVRGCDGRGASKKMLLEHLALSLSAPR